MLAAVKGYYDGTQIVMDEDIHMAVGQEVIITVLDIPNRAKKKIDLKKYIGRGEKMFHTDAQEYIKEMRADDRI
ncbi:MAG: hypothetical protein K1W19_04425 [Lachnospiraceae bacterium]